MAYLRSKERGGGTLTGTVTEDNGSSQTESYFVQNDEYISGFVPGDAPVSHFRVESSPTPWGGRISRTPCYVWWNPHGWTQLDGVLAGLTLVPPAPTLSEVAFSATKMLAASHPGKPAVSLPNFFYELKDLPMMLRGDGIRAMNKDGRTNSNWHRPANAYLAGSFGWGPLIGDLLKMYDYTAGVEKKMRRLNKTFSSTGSSTTMQFGSVQDSFLQVDRNMVYGWGDTRTTASTTTWGSARWRSSAPAPENEQALRSLATRANFGIGISPKQIWDMVPWSWFHDWFVDVGGYLQATDNSYSIFATDVFRHDKVIQDTVDENVRPHQGMCPEEDTITAGSGRVSKMSYRRLRSGATLDAGVPILSLGQVATATSLIQTRVRAPR